MFFHWTDKNHCIVQFGLLHLMSIYLASNKLLSSPCFHLACIHNMLCVCGSVHLNTSCVMIGSKRQLILSHNPHVLPISLVPLYSVSKWFASYPTIRLTIYSHTALTYVRLVTIKHQYHSITRKEQTTTKSSI